MTHVIEDTFESDFADDDVFTLDDIDNAFVEIDVAFALRTWQRDHAVTEG